MARHLQPVARSSCFACFASHRYALHGISKLHELFLKNCSLFRHCALILPIFFLLPFAFVYLWIGFLTCNRSIISLSPFRFSIKFARVRNFQLRCTNTARGSNVVLFSTFTWHAVPESRKEFDALSLGYVSAASFPRDTRNVLTLYAFAPSETGF